MQSSKLLLLGILGKRILSSIQPPPAPAPAPPAPTAPTPAAPAPAPVPTPPPAPTPPAPAPVPSPSEQFGVTLVAETKVWVSTTYDISAQHSGVDFYNGDTGMLALTFENKSDHLIQIPLPGEVTGLFFPLGWSTNFLSLNPGDTAQAQVGFTVTGAVGNTISFDFLGYAQPITAIVLATPM